MTSFFKDEDNGSTELAEVLPAIASRDGGRMSRSVSDRLTSLA